VGHVGRGQHPLGDGASQERWILTEELPDLSARPAVETTSSTLSGDHHTSDWRLGLPTLTGSIVAVRELRISDAPSLFLALSTEEVSRFISPPPTSIEGFERFIAWTHQQRAAGHHVCFGIVPSGLEAAVGLFQVRSLEGDFGVSEWGFALASEHWGSGAFVDGAQLVAEFGFGTLRVRRLEARASVLNGRGNGALRKLGAVQEGVLRRSFLRSGESFDQVLWSILRDEWQPRQTPIAPTPVSADFLILLDRAVILPSSDR
jgi:ribosomal-protein-alanine N-acetyltransferase